MTALREQMSPAQADRFFVTWSADELGAALKQCLRVRKFRLRLDYTTHTPMLFIVNADGVEFLWRIFDTRKFTNGVIVLPDKAVNEQAFADHVGETLEKAGFKLMLGHQRPSRRDRIKRERALLMLVSEDSRHYVLSVLNVDKGSYATIHGGN